MNDSSEAPAASWSPIGKTERRVLGVLIEKAKTTPENYPLSLAAMVTGSNQKSNRAPQMQLDDDDVTLALDQLRQLGAVREIQGSGRVTKFRHAAYEWLGVDAAGAALMTELLLRGPQTLGELRSRTSRMHDFPKLESVADAVATLQQAGLVQPLTPPGRGQTFAHRLYPDDEQQYLAEKFAGNLPFDSTAAVVTGDPSPTSHHAPRSDTAGVSADRLESWEQRLETMQAEIEELKRRLDRIAP